MWLQRLFLSGAELLFLASCFVPVARAQLCHPDESWSDPFLNQQLSANHIDMVFQMSVAACQHRCCVTAGCIAIEYKSGHVNKQCNLFAASHLDGTNTLSAASGWDYYYKGPNVGDYTNNNEPACAGGGLAATDEWYSVSGYAIRERNLASHSGYTLDQCKTECCNTWWCKSFDFGNAGECHLSTYLWYEVDFYAISSHSYYQASYNMPPSPPRAPSLGYLQPQLQQSWDEAAATCEGLGGMLAVPHNQAEWDAMVASRVTSTSFWIGVHSPAGNDIYRGLDGTYTWSTYTNWYTNKPTGSTDRRCVVARYQSGHGWVDNTCGTARNFICQNTRPPEPALPPAPPAPPQPPPYPPGAVVQLTCQAGIKLTEHIYGDAHICCAASCGTCGGRSCNNRDGSGATQTQSCCAGHIIGGGITCATPQDTGCILPNSPPPPSAPPPSLPCGDTTPSPFTGSMNCEMLTSGTPSEGSYDQPTVSPPPPLQPGVGLLCTCEGDNLVALHCRGTCSTFCLLELFPAHTHPIPPWPDCEFPHVRRLLRIPPAARARARRAHRLEAGRVHRVPVHDPRRTGQQ